MRTGSKPLYKGHTLPPNSFYTSKFLWIKDNLYTGQNFLYQHVLYLEVPLYTHLHLVFLAFPAWDGPGGGPMELVVNDGTATD